MASLELQILSNVIHDGSLRDLQKNGVTPSLFQTEEAREIYRWLTNEAAAHHNEVPSLDRVRRHFPEFSFSPSRDSVAALLTDLISNYTASEMRNLLEEVDGLLDEGEEPQLVLQSMLPQIRDLQLQSGSRNHLQLSKMSETFRQERETMLRSGGITGIPFPWKPLNVGTAGMQREDFIVIYGRPKNMKCVEDTQRVVAQDGSLVPIRDFAGAAPSYTDATGRLRWASTRVVASGQKECVRVTTDYGRELITSTEHYYMVPCGSFQGHFERIENLSVGDLIGVAPMIPQWTPHDSLSVDEAWLLGMFFEAPIGPLSELDLPLVHAPELVDNLRLILRRLGISARVTPREEAPGWRVLPDPGQPIGQAVAWLRVFGGSLARVYTSTPEAIAAFLAGLLDARGVSHVGPGGASGIRWIIRSKDVALGVQHLLGRHGISAAVSERDGGFADGYYVRIKTCPAQFRKTARVLYPHVVSRYKRTRIRSLADREDPEEPSAKSRVWERIKSIEPVGLRSCSDIIITDGQDPNFVVEGFLVHNTWVACAMAAHAYAYGNSRVLMYSKEMSTIALARRTASIVARVDYQKLKDGSLPDEEAEDFFEAIEFLEEWEQESARNGGKAAAMRFLSDRDIRGSKNGSTVDMIAAEAERFDADLIVVDGFYLMRDGRTNQRSRDWKPISNISSDLKNMAQRLKVPVIGTTQANRSATGTRGDDLGELGFADAIGQDSDLVMRVFKGRDSTNQNRPKIMFTFPGVRDAVLNPFVIRAYPGADFSLLQSTVNVEAFLKDKEYADTEDQQKTGLGGGKGAGSPAARTFGKRKKKPVSARLKT